MAKKSRSLLQDVYLLYFLFIATILHLGYFIVNKETRSLILFSLVVLFVYLVNPNMILVLSISLLFVDLLYLVQSTQEGLIGDMPELKFYPEDENGNIPGIDVSYNDVSGNTEPFESTGKKPINPLLNAEQLLLNQLVDPTQGFADNSSLNDVEHSSNSMKTIIDKAKKTSPELFESLKMLNSVDIPELNKIINAANS